VGEQAGENPRTDDPREESSDEPIDFPRPFLDSLIGNVKAAGREASEPMIENAKNWVHIF
jgi:hypothetical protein